MLRLVEVDVDVVHHKENESKRVNAATTTGASRYTVSFILSAVQRDLVFCSRRRDRQKIGWSR